MRHDGVGGGGCDRVERRLTGPSTSHRYPVVMVSYVW